METMLTTDDVADFFRVDVVTVRRMIGKGELTAYRVGGEYRLARADIDDYLERQRIPARTTGQGPLRKLTGLARKHIPAESIPDAFERFTKRARSVVALAQEEAHELGHAFMGSEHLLLGILREGEGVGAKLLLEAGCNLDSMRQSVRDTVGAGPASGIACDELAVTPRLKKVLALAAEEAKRLDHSYIGTEHLALGLVHEGEGVAGRLLTKMGIDLEAARSRVIEMLISQKDR